MEILDMLDNLEDTIDRGKSIPLFGKCLLDKDELLDLVQEVRLKFPDDLKQAKWIKDERQRILLEAQKEANDIIKTAEDKIVNMINESEITRRANEQAAEIINTSNRRAKEIKQGTRNYTEDALSSVETVLEKTLQTLRDNRNSMAHREVKRQNVEE